MNTENHTTAKTMEKGALVVQNLQASVAGTPILRGVSLQVAPGKVHAVMGPNGSGKSTLSACIMGHPGYEVTGGTVVLDGVDILACPPHERARQGLFLSFQYPVALPGVSLAQLLHTAYNERFWDGSVDRIGRKRPVVSFSTFYKDQLLPAAKLLALDEAFLERNVNDGLSGGEKKKSEILQLAILQPAFAILDETDSGLDIDALRVVATGIKAVQQKHPTMGLLVITHYQRILEYLKPDVVHVMVDGAIAQSGDREIITKLEQHGYAHYRN